MNFAIFNGLCLLGSDRKNLSGAVHHQFSSVGYEMADRGHHVIRHDVVVRLPIADLAEPAIDAEVFAWFDLPKPEGAVTEVFGWDHKKGVMVPGDPAAVNQKRGLRRELVHGSGQVVRISSRKKKN